MRNFLDQAWTPANRALQAARDASGIYDDSSPGADELSQHEQDHITAANSFYMATVNEEGWPYVQHRGGDRGFVSVIGPTTLGWVERKGNRQYIGAGNLQANGRVSLIFVDYPNRTRLKLFGEAKLHTEPSRPLLSVLGGGALRHDGVITVDVTATAWNCPKHITPRYEAAHVTAEFQVLQDRIDALEAENEKLRSS